MIRNIRASLICAAALAFTAYSAVAQPGPPPAYMALTSSAFSDSGIIPNKFSQAVPKPVSPALAWHDAPPATVSFTLMVHDPDSAPQKNSDDTLHWMVFNIPGTVNSLAEGQPAIAQLPDGSVQLTGRGVIGYRGMGAQGNVYHHYVFELFALDTKLSLGADAARADVLRAMDGHVLAKAVYVGLFHR